MRRKTFNINVSTINGQIQASPVLMQFVCYEPIAVGEAIVRDYDDNDCIIAKKVLLFRVNENVFGTEDFQNKVQFWNYQQGLCSTCSDNNCRIIISGCLLQYNGCNLTYNNREGLN